MPDKASTWREQRVTLQPGQSNTIYFLDTQPNHVLVSNNSPSPLYLCASTLASPSTFDMIIPAYGSKMYARQDGLKRVEIYADATQPVQAVITSFVDTFNPASIPQTQEIVSQNAEGLLGVVNVGSVLNPLPSGTNTIGSVVIADYAKGLPAGNNKIGSVDVASLPALNVSSLPAIESVGEEGNLWNAANVNAGDVSTAVDISSVKDVSIFGHVSAAANLTVQYSQDGTTFYGGEKITCSAAQDFVFHVRTGAKFMRLQTDAAITITATLGGKA